MPASLVLSAIYGDMILAGAALGSVGVAAASFAINIVATAAITSLLVKNEQPGEVGQQGGRVQLPAATNNKLPVVYGDAWVSPIIVDAKISPDQQEMVFVLALSEATDSGDISFGNVYWDDKRLLFDPATPSKIWGWFIEGESDDPTDNTIVTGVANKIEMWFYKNGTATGTTHHCVSQSYVGSEQPTTVTPQQLAWTVDGVSTPFFDSNFAMTDTVYVICRVVYDADHGVTTLGQLRFNVKNTLKQPGSVMLDYLQNDRYGCGVDAANINTQQFTDLNTYSDDIAQIGDVSFTRYEINGIIETSKDCLTNLITIADSADSWVQWNEQQGKWGVLMNRALTEAGGSTSTMRVIGSDAIIGGIQVSPLDLNATYNSINVQFPNLVIQDQSDFRLLEIDPGDRSPYEPNNQLSLNLPLVNNDAQATYIGWKRLYSSRNDIIINFTTDYSGIQIDAGEIIAVQHPWYGFNAGSYNGLAYPGKPFRVTQVRELKFSDGSLGAQITATAYNHQDYIPGEHYSTVRNFSGLIDPEYISKPDAPTLPASLNQPEFATFVVQGNIPDTGNVLAMEFWYSETGASLADNNYVLYSVERYSEGSNYPKKDSTGAAFFEQTRFDNMPTGSYYFRTRAQGASTVSEFSDASPVLVWTAESKKVSGTQIEDGTLTGSKVVTGDPQKVGQSDSGGFFDTLGPIALAGLGAAATYGLWKNGSLNDLLPKEWTPAGGGNDVGTEDLGKPEGSYLWADISEPEIGDEVTYYMDATPDPGPVYDYFSYDDYDVGWFDSGDDSWYDWV